MRGCKTMRGTVAMLLFATLFPLVPIGGELEAAGPDVAEVVFEDAFTQRLGDGWTWLREDPAHWRIRGDALEIMVRPGKAATVKNALVRPAPDRTEAGAVYAIDVMVKNLSRPKRQYEQAGITWYTGGKPVFKLVKEYIDGATYIIPGRKPLASVSVQLRLVIVGDQWTAQYRPDGEGEFLTAAKGKLPPAGEDQVSLQCYDGPEDAEHWMRFDDFRVTRLSAPK